MPQRITRPIIEQHLARLRACRRCPRMLGPVVVPRPVAGRVYLLGQAPGPREGVLGRPFAWTAGKTLFRWFESLGVDEDTFRARAYIGAVCRCFPGKNPRGGDRVPSPDEIETCAPWMQAEFELLRPKLVIPVGRLAIERFLEPAPLVEIVGDVYRIRMFGRDLDVIPLPHPSGVSTWYKREPGMSRLAAALHNLVRHPAWTALSAMAAVKPRGPRR